MAPFLFRLVGNRLVIKFGGDALATEERIIAAARFVVYLVKVLGYEVVVVVSAMGKTTDNDLALIGRVTTNPDRLLQAKLLRTGEDRSAAILALAINAADPDGKVHAVAPDTHKAGLLVTEDSGRMRIVRGRGIRPFERMLRRRGQIRTILVFSGFQGVTEEEDVVVLERGTSDLSARCFAEVFRAQACVLYKAYPGVAAVDPSIIGSPRYFGYMTPDLFLDLVETGVVMRNAVEAFRDSRVPLIVCQSPSINPAARDDFRRPGRRTVIAPSPPSRELEQALPAVAVLNIPRDVVFFQMPRVRPGSPPADRIYAAVGAVASLVEEHEMRGGLLLVVRKDVADLVHTTIKRVYHGLVFRRDNWAMLALADRRMAGARGYVERMRLAIKRGGARVLGGWSTGHKVVRLVALEELRGAAQALADEFGLREKRKPREAR